MKQIGSQLHWTWEPGNGGKFASTNRPIAGATHDKELPVLRILRVLLRCRDLLAAARRTYHPEQLLDIPAALEEVITEENAGRIKAATLIEVANGPVSSAADPILEENGVFVIPDILANAGGVTVSYFEWVQNKAGYYWSEREVQDKLQEKMSHEYWEVHERSQQKNIDMRTAAYAHALSRIGKAITAQGTKDFFHESDS